MVGGSNRPPCSSSSSSSAVIDFDAENRKLATFITYTYGAEHEAICNKLGLQAVSSHTHPINICTGCIAAKEITCHLEIVITGRNVAVGCKMTRKLSIQPPAPSPLYQLPIPSTKRPSKDEPESLHLIGDNESFNEGLRVGGDWPSFLSVWNLAGIVKWQQEDRKSAKLMAIANAW